MIFSLALFAFIFASDPVAFVGAELEPTESTTDDNDGNLAVADAPTENNNDVGITESGNVAAGAEPTTEDPVPLPASLMKATRVGAKLREVQQQTDQEEPDKDLDGTPQETSPEMNSPNANSADDAPRNPKTPHTGCHWGATGCNSKKGKIVSGTDVNNASSIESDSAEGDDGAKPPPTTSLAGSATAKIEAHVIKGRGPTLNQRRPGTATPTWERNNAENKDAQHHGNEPPQGFKLAGRIVTSPSDGLSYFLDAPQVDPDSNDGDWIDSIPYAYLECGSTIESTTEAFSLSDMVLRHFPASASMRHWTNLGGGVTIENGVVDEGGSKDEETVRYIDGNHEGHPKLLVALSPIEITVSGNNEESRIFNSGEVILMEDTLGKGHKMRAANVNPDNNADVHRDLSVLMVTLPHTVHFPSYDWLEESSYFSESPVREDARKSALEDSSSAADASSASPPTSFGAERALFGFAPKHLHKNRSMRKRSSLASANSKPCPLEYDSAYSSLFMPSHNQHHRHRRNRKNQRWREGDPAKAFAFDDSYHPPPGFTTYEQESMLFHVLPSLRRTMLFGLGLSLTTSFIFCVQLLYPPLLVLFGGGTVILGGSLLSVLATRRGYRNWIANWEEEWRWKREVRTNKMHRQEAMVMMQEFANEIVEDVDINENDNLQSNEQDGLIFDEVEASESIESMLESDEDAVEIE